MSVLIASQNALRTGTTMTEARRRHFRAMYGMSGVVRGTYDPNVGVAISQLQSPTETELTALHEQVHSYISNNTSLGSLYIVGSLASEFSENEAIRSHLADYVDIFCAQSEWVQEGAATAAEFLRARQIGLSDSGIRSIRPRRYW